MSQKNVEIVRAALHAFGEGGLDAAAEFWHPDIDWRAAEGAIDDAGEIQGTGAMRRYVHDWLDIFDDATIVPEELFDVGDDRVVAMLRVAGRAKLSGIETEFRYAVVYTVLAGKIVRGREYIEKAEALKAVGLEQ
jgi:ketosteroid isomerase-like protein